MANHTHLLRKLNVCEEAVTWYDNKDSQEAWETCIRGDWMLWIANRIGVDKALIVLAACDCVELATQHIPSNEDRPKSAIAAARRWVVNPTETNQQDARNAAYAAYAAASATSAAFAAYAAAYAAADATADATAYAAADAAASAAASAAAYAVYAAAYAVYAATHTTDAAYATDAAVYTAASAARVATLKTCANIVRKHITWDMVNEKIK